MRDLIILGTNNPYDDQLVRWGRLTRKQCCIDSIVPSHNRKEKLFSGLCIFKIFIVILELSSTGFMISVQQV